MGNTGLKLDSLFSLLAGVDETFRKLPLNMRLEIEKISQGLTEFGPRKLRRRGPGSEFFEAREFRPDADDPRKINARLSARTDKQIVVEREAEISQHVFLWCDSSPSMKFSSRKDIYTKEQSAQIMLLAFAKHLARNEEKVGILDRKGIYRGGKASEALAQQLFNVTIMTGDMPVVARKLPRNSTAVLFSDFLMDPDELMRGLDRLTGLNLKGYMVMVLDPQELDFLFRGHVEFEGMEGEGKEKFRKAESMRDPYQEKMKAHIEWVQRVCAAKGFKLILQRTDEPLHKGLMAIYGLSSTQAPARSPAPGF